MKVYSWSGNMRQLRNVVQCACTLGAGEEIMVDDLPADLRAEDHPPKSSSDGFGAAFLAHHYILVVWRMVSKMGYCDDPFG